MNQAETNRKLDQVADYSQPKLSCSGHCSAKPALQEHWRLRGCSNRTEGTVSKRCAARICGIAEGII